MKYLDMQTAIISIIFAFYISACNVGSGENLDAQGQVVSENAGNNDDNSNGGGSDSGDNGNDDNDVGQDGIQPTLSSIQENVFTPICSVCHGGASPAAGQNLATIEDTIANVINVDSSNPQFKRVLPGSPEESYLYLKITGDSRAGARMPLGQPALSQDKIDAIKQWIADGALAPESKTPVQVSRIERTTTDEMRRNNHEQLTLWFNQAMDFSTLSREQITLELISASETFIEQRQLLTFEQASIAVENDHKLKITSSIIVDDDVILSKKRLRITINNSSISTITSALGQVLDGDNNNMQGGEFVYELTL